jgi:hypothetical protein
MQIYSVPYRGYGLLPFQVVLPQTGGSHKAGFRLVYSNTKGDFRLDGVFNVISYDVVPKIQSTLLDLDFKVDFFVTYFISFEENYCRKGTHRNQQSISRSTT